jgi:hypothetical protein
MKCVPASGRLACHAGTNSARYSSPVTSKACTACCSNPAQPNSTARQAIWWGKLNCQAAPTGSTLPMICSKTIMQSKEPRLASTVQSCGVCMACLLLCCCCHCDGLWSVYGLHSTVARKARCGLTFSSSILCCCSGVSCIEGGGGCAAACMPPCLLGGGGGIIPPGGLGGKPPSIAIKSLPEACYLKRASCSMIFLMSEIVLVSSSYHFMALLQLIATHGHVT